MPGNDIRLLKYFDDTLTVFVGSSSFLRCRSYVLYIISILPSRRLSIWDGGRATYRLSPPRRHLNDDETQARPSRPICVAAPRQSRRFCYLNYGILCFKRASRRNFQRSFRPSTFARSAPLPVVFLGARTHAHARIKVFHSPKKYSKARARQASARVKFDLHVQSGGLLIEKATGSCPDFQR